MDTPMKAKTLVVALAVFFLVVYPANVEFASWTPADVPADWRGWRARWEYGHITGAALQFLVLTLLLLPLLRTSAGASAETGYRDTAQHTR
ncbi:hypothetical protein [Bounagaea algeriensis]